MPEFRHLRLDESSADAVTVWIDVAGRSMNVLAAAMVDELVELVGRLERSSDTRPVVFRSAKPSGFLAGADLAELAAFRTADDVRQFLDRGQGLLDRISRLPQRTVAVVHGACLGGGLEVALACDQRIARADAATKLGLPETLLGLTPAWGGTHRLPRLIGLAPALRLMLTGGTLDVDQARQLGVVDATARPAQFDDDVLDFVRAGSVARQRPPGSRFPDPPRIACLRQMVAARRSSCPDGQLTPAQQAVLGAVAAAFGLTVLDESTTVREDFNCLLFSEFAQQQLAAFLARRQPGTGR